MTEIFLILAAYLLGSVPFGMLIARGKGVNLKKVGSGNIGTTNVLRSVGKWPALLTLSGDVIKGTVAVVLGRYIDAGLFFEGILGISAILGHNFSVFLKFKGGKGVATSIGVIAVYSPFVALITVATWIAVVIVFRYSSLGALVSFGLLPLNIAMFDSREKLPFALIITILLFIRHTDNIKRLLKGDEGKVGQKG